MQETACLICSKMEGAADLHVPLRVKCSVGPSWGMLQPLTPEH